MKKFAVFSGAILFSIIISGLYGILHDQVTYSISPEYFTKFKYEQFGFEPAWFGGDRQTVVVIGFLATWWTGLIIGLGLGLTGLIFKDPTAMHKAIQKAIIVTLCFAVGMGFFGFYYGIYNLTKTGVDWWLPENLIDKDAFITVGSIHNFGYLGGLLGLVAGMYYIVRLYTNQKNRATEAI